MQTRFSIGDKVCGANNTDMAKYNSGVGTVVGVGVTLDGEHVTVSYDGDIVMFPAKQALFDIQFRIDVGDIVMLKDVCASSHLKEKLLGKKMKVVSVFKTEFVEDICVEVEGVSGFRYIPRSDLLVLGK